MSSTSRPERQPVPPNPSASRGIAHLPNLPNLPVPLTPLLGRSEELAAVRALLDGDETRLLTLTGPGGIGKTRLALEVASQVQNDFAHGACFVTLAALRDPDLVPSAVARALGVRESNDHSIADVLATALSTRHLLLVIDNMEQVAAAAPWLTDLLTTCPRLKVLVTSRIPLRIRGEQRFPVPPLPVPDADRQQPVETLSQYASVTLFVQCARAVQPSFALTEANATAVRDICRRLDGLPLAIELAAPRVNVLSPAAILARLSGRLAFLANRMKDVPLRLQTMRNAVAWSYDLLSPDEQALFRRLAVFTGGFTLDAAGVIANAGDGETENEDVREAGPRDLESQTSVLDLIASLVDQSMVQRVPSEHGEPRFGMLETIREYGLELLNADAESAAVRRCHAVYFLGLAQEIVPRLDHDDHVSLMLRLAAEQANLRAALQWTVDQDEAETGLLLAAALWRFWFVRGEYREGTAVLDALLALPSASARMIARGRGLSAAGALSVLGSPTRDDEAMLHEAIDIARELDDQGGLVFALLTLGWLTIFHHDDVDMATRYMHQGLDLCRTLGIRWGCATAFHGLGRAAVVQGDLDLARTYFEEMLAIARDEGNRQGMADSLEGLGSVARANGNIEQALTLYREVLHHLASIGERGIVAIPLEELAGVLGALGRTERAARLFGAAAALRQTTGALVFPRDVPIREAERERLRSALGDAAFSASWSAGEAMTLDEAIALAVTDEPELIGQVPTRIPRSNTSHGLSRRELEVLQLMADGLTNQEIADILFLSHRTVTSHTSNILGKLDLTSRTAAVAYAIRNGLA